MENCKGNRILIIDDNLANIQLLEGILREDDFTDYLSVTDPREALATFLGYKPDLVLLDMHMPHMDGYEVMEQIHENIPPGDFLPILVLTADNSNETKHRALLVGATDFLAKPLDTIEVTLRIRNLLHTRTLHQQLQRQNEFLNKGNYPISTRLKEV